MHPLHHVITISPPLKVDQVLKNEILKKNLFPHRCDRSNNARPGLHQIHMVLINYSSTFSIQITWFWVHFRVSKFHSNIHISTSDYSISRWRGRVTSRARWAPGRCCWRGSWPGCRSRSRSCPCCAPPPPPPPGCPRPAPRCPCCTWTCSRGSAAGSSPGERCLKCNVVKSKDDRERKAKTYRTRPR